MVANRLRRFRWSPHDRSRCSVLTRDRRYGRGDECSGPAPCCRWSSIPSGFRPASSTNGDVLVRDRIGTPSRDVWPVLEQLIGRVVAAAPDDVAAPESVRRERRSTPFDQTAGSVSPHLIPAWTAFPLRESSSRSCTGLPVVVDTDAASARGLAEAWCGAARQIDSDRSRSSSTRRSSRRCIVSGRPLLRRRAATPGYDRPRRRRARWSAVLCGGTGCLDRVRRGRPIEAETNRPLRRATDAIVERTGMMVGRALAPHAGRSSTCRPSFIGGSVVGPFGEPLLEAVHREVDAARAPAPTSATSVRCVGADRPGRSRCVGRGGTRAGGLQPTDRRDSDRSGLASAHAARRTPPRPRPTARRCRPSSPRSCRPSGGASARSRATTIDRLRHRVAQDAVRGGLPRAGLADRVRRRRAVGARAGDPRRGVRQGRRADRWPERRLRHPDARQHAAEVGHRRAEAPLPAADPVRRRHVVPGLLASPTPASTSATSASRRSSTATSGCSTARRSGRRPATSPTTSSRSPAPIPTRPSTRASRSCSSTCASPASRCARSR